MTEEKQEGWPTALLVGSYAQDEKAICVEHLHELKALAKTAEIEGVREAPYFLRKIDRATYVGSGKLIELKELADDLDVSMIIFDEELTPSQQRNLESFFKKTVLERTEVILRVFYMHAKTKESKLQVELAQCRYQLPRLKRLWTHLSRQRGGGVFLKGKGEQQIELDRRLLAERIKRLKKELTGVRKVRATQRSARQKQQLPTFALVGYTNAGKSTLLKALTEADVLVEDKLFATLDTTIRKLTLPHSQEVLLIDTVGFIRKIPHQLVAAFKSTLEEVVYADILLHIVDASHPMALEQAQETIKVLSELKADQKPTLTIVNKSDVGFSTQGDKVALTFPKTVALSCTTQEGFDELIAQMSHILEGMRSEYSLRIPQSEYRWVAQVLEKGEVLESDYEENDILLRVRINSDLASHLTPFIIDASPPPDSNDSNKR